MTEAPRSIQPVKTVFVERSLTLYGRLARQEMLCSYRGGVLHVVHRRAWLRRHIDVANLIAAALERLDLRRVPIFFVNTDDLPRLSHPRRQTRFAFASAAGSDDVAAPDFTFGSWPEARIDDYDRKAAEMAAAGVEAPRDDRVIWRGRRNNPWRHAFIEIAKQRPDLFDVVDLNQAFDDAAQTYQSAFVPMEEQVRSHRYLIDVEGAGYSARLKLLLHSGRAMLLQGHPWREWFFDDLVPFRHFVPVARDFSNLAERVEWLRAHPAEEAAIAAEAQAFARQRLTRDAAIEAWAGLIDAHIRADGRLKSGLGD